MICCQGLLDVGRPEATWMGRGLGKNSFGVASAFILPIYQLAYVCVCVWMCLYDGFVCDMFCEQNDIL